MKRLKEVVAEYEERCAPQRKVACSRVQQLLEETAHCSALYSGDPAERTRYECTRYSLRRQAESGAFVPIGIACNHCGHELLNVQPGVVLPTSPPKIRIGCLGCGFTGSMPRAAL